VNGGVPAATLLAAEASIADEAKPGEAKRATVSTRVVSGAPLSLSLVVHQDPARPGEVVETELTVANRGAVFVSARVEARLPEGMDAFAQSLSEGASCSATTLQCAPAKIVRWTIGLIPAGGAATVRMPPMVAQATADGSLLRFQALAYDVGAGATAGRNAVIGRTVLVNGAAPFDLALTDSPDPVPGAQMLTYALHFGRPAATDSSGTALRLSLPAGAFFVSATDGGTLVGDDLVEWDLGEIVSGETGLREVTAVVDDLPAGTPLRARAAIEDADDPTSEKRADAVSTVQAPALQFSISAEPDPVTPGQAVTVSLSVTNTGASAVNNAIIEAIVPPEANSFQDTATTGGGICGPFGSNACNPRQRVLFPIPTIPAGQTVIVTIPPVIRGDVEPGSVVRLVGWFRESISTPPTIAVGAVTVE
jgi:uncharacterized repeat protein (TIGR01451 family)